MSINVGKKHRSIDYNTKILEVKNLKKYFTVGVGRQKLVVPAVDDVSFDIYKREVFGLVGESGCGKTTTGRTIIKLYNPTAGSVKLNDVEIGAGDKEHIDRIKAIKKQLSYDIIQLDEKKRLTFEIEQSRDREIEELKHQEKLLELNYQTEQTAIEEPIFSYRQQKYALKEKYKFDVENIKYLYIIEKAEINKLKTNQVEELYKKELAIEKNKFKNKLIGLKESAALLKADKEQRIEALKVEHKNDLEALDAHFSSLIEDGQKAIIPAAEVREKIKAIRETRNNDLAQVKQEYLMNLEALEMPNKEAIEAALAALKEKHEAEKADIKHKIAEIKENASKAIKAIPNNVETPEEKANKAQEIQALKEKANAEIKAEKESIVRARRINKSKEALLMSQKMQMIFQDPISSLNPRMTVKEIVGEGLIIQKQYSNAEITERVGEALELVGLAREHAMRYPHEFSGGQRQRIGVARALIMQPNFIIADEPISALDVSIQAQVINLLQDLKNKLDLTILFIAHDLSVVRFFCDRIAVMYNGKLMEMAESEELFNHPMHPYTKSLLSAIPVPDPDYEKNRARVHYNPRMHDYRFDKPSLKEIADGHYVYANDKEFEALKQEYQQQSKKERS